MNPKYLTNLKDAIKSFWTTRSSVGVLPGKQLDEFLKLIKQVAMDAGVPESCIFTKNNHIPGYYRASKDWDLIIVSPQKNLIAAIELKSQIGSYGNNLNNRTEESLGSSEDFWTAFREKAFPCKQSPWLGYLMLVGKDDKSTHKVIIYEPHFSVRPEFKEASYLDRYRILCQRLILEHKYNAVALIATSGPNHYESLDNNISIESFFESLRGHLLGCEDDFK